MTDATPPRRLSPIERMIDEACGHTPGRALTDRAFVTLECPTCKKKKTVARHKSDLPGTVRVVTPCPDCSDETAIIDYFDANGKQITHD